MRIDQTTARRALLFAFVAAGLLAAPGLSVPPAPAAEPSPRVVRFLGDRAARVLARAGRVEVFRVKEKRAAEGEKSVGGYAIATTGNEQGAQSARRVAGMLLDEKTYRFDRSTVGGFTPLVGLRLWEGERSVDVLLSFATDEAVVFSRNPDDGSVRSAQADVSPARAAWVEFVKQALPDDKAVHAIESSTAEGKTLSASTGTVPR